MRRARILVAAFAALLQSPARGGDLAHLAPSTENVDLDDFSEVFVDPSCSLDVAQASSPSRRYLPLGHDRNLGFTSACVWMHVAIENSAPDWRTWAITWAHPLMERIDLYLPVPGGFRDLHGGTEVPPAERGIVHHGAFHEADVRLAPGEKADLYLRLKTRSPMLLGLEVWAPAALDAFEHRMMLVLGLSLGALLVLSLLNLYSFLVLRDRSYLWFFLVLVAAAGYQLAETGMGAAWFWPGASLWALRAPVLFASAAIAAGLLFARRFLEAQQVAPRLAEAGVALAYLAAAAGLSSFADLRIAHLTVAALGTAAFLLTAAWSLASLATGVRAARFFLGAALGFLVFALAFALTAIGVVPPNVASLNGIQIGVSIAGVVFTFALGDRLQTLNLRARDELEQEVRARTAKLKETVEALRLEADDRRRAEAARSETEERFRLAFKTIPDAVAIHRLEDGRYVAVNNGFVEVTGWAEAEVVGRTLEDLEVWGAEDRERVLALLAEDGQVRGLEVRLRHRDGSARDGVLSANVVALGGDPLVLSVVRDVTEQRRAEGARGRLEEELRRSQKMEAIGRLAGGVAHDFNNTLTVVAANVALLLLETPEGDRRRAALLEIEETVQRAAALTRQLLAFGSPQALDARPVSLNGLVEGLRKMFGRLVGDDVELSLDLAEGLPALVADPAHVEQVLLNLVVNARDALQHGGRIAISTREAEVAETDDTPERRAGRYQVLSVADTGRGMAPGAVDHVFEPFFTTKPAGEGSGLGLSAVYGIARQHGGFVEVETREGQGSTFSVWLPVRPAPAAEPVPAEAGALALPRGSEAVLLVEDDEGVRQSTAALLARLGYKVHAAASGSEGLAILERQGGIDLVLTDLAMPRMSGLALARAVQIRWPSVRVILLSGYPSDALASPGGRASGLHFLAKPWTPEALARKMRDVLEAGLPPRA